MIFRNHLSIIISSAVEASARHLCGQKTGIPPGLLDDCSAFVSGSIMEVPTPFSLPLTALFVFLDISTLPGERVRFHKLEQQARQHHLNSWRVSKLSFKRDLVRLIDSLTIMRATENLMDASHKGKHGG